VVNISSLSRPGTNPSEQTKQQWNDYEEHIHEHLGVWGGRLISGLLRPRDILGTGGGRGSYYTAQHVFASPASLGAGNVLSLTGQIGTFPENRQHENYAHHVDADYVASFLHGGFQTAGKPVLIGSSITEKRNHPQSSENVTVALTGIGALEGRSRFKQFELFPRLHPVSALLRSINQIADEIEQLYQKKGLHFFHPVGDLCNWFFSVEPAGSEKMPHRKLLDSAIQKLNKKLLNTAHEELPKIAARGAVIAVAGGPHKTGAIGCALRNGKVEPRITHLVTDHYVAQDLLKQEELGLSSGHLP
jgi:DNA-binding transcriptional regulator LsrR (DeoR family)